MTEQTQDFTKITDEQLLDKYLKGQYAIEELEASLSVIKDELSSRLDAEHLKGKVIGNYAVSKVSRTNFRPTLEQAKELAATKMVETVDTAALKRLFDQGVPIPNTTTATYVMVKPLEKKAE